jgi:hypothetical protein
MIYEWKEAAAELLNVLFAALGWTNALSNLTVGSGIQVPGAYK